MSLSPHKKRLPNFAEIAAADNNTIREDVENEQTATDRNRDSEAGEVNHMSEKKSVRRASVQKSAQRHIERIRNSYKKRQQDLESKINGGTAACNSAQSKSRKSVLPPRHQSVCVTQQEEPNIDVQDVLSDSLSPSKSVRNRALSNLQSCLSQNEDLRVESIAVHQDHQTSTCDMLQMAAAKQVGLAPKNINEQLRGDKSRRHFSFQNTPGKEVPTPVLRSGSKSPVKRAAQSVNKSPVQEPAILHSDYRMNRSQLQQSVPCHFESALAAEFQRENDLMLSRADEFASIMTEEVQMPYMAHQGANSPLKTEQTQVLNLRQYQESAIGSEAAIDINNQTIMSDTLARVDVAMPDEIHSQNQKQAEVTVVSPQRKPNSPVKISNLMQHVRSVAETHHELTQKKNLTMRSVSRSPVKQPLQQNFITDLPPLAPATPKDMTAANPASKLFTFNSQKHEQDLPGQMSEEEGAYGETSDNKTQTGHGSVPQATSETQMHHMSQSHERSTCKKPSVAGAYQGYIYGASRKTSGLLGAILNSGSVKDRARVGAFGSTHKPTQDPNQHTASKPQQSEYKQMIPRFEVTPDCQKQYQTGSFQPSQQSGGEKKDTKLESFKTDTKKLTPAGQQSGNQGQPRLGSIGRQSATSNFDRITQSFSGVTIPQKLVQRKRPAKVNAKGLEPSSPFSMKSNNARSNRLTRPSMATYRPTKSGVQRDISPSALSSNTTNARVFNTFDNNLAPSKKSTSVAGTTKNKSVSGMNTSLRSKNPAVTRKPAVPTQASIRQSSNNARAKAAPSDLMESVREAASQYQRKLFNQAQASAARKRQDARISQLYLPGRSTDAATKPRGYLTGVRNSKNMSQVPAQQNASNMGRTAAKHRDTSWSRRSAANTSCMATGISDHVKLMKKNQAARNTRATTASQAHHSVTIDHNRTGQGALARRPAEKRRPQPGTLTACPSRSRFAANKEQLSKFVKSSSLKRFDEACQGDNYLEAPQFICGNGSVDSGHQELNERDLGDEEPISVTIPNSQAAISRRAPATTIHDQNNSVLRMDFAEGSLDDMIGYEEGQIDQHKQSVIVQQSVLRSPYRSPSPMNDMSGRGHVHDHLASSSPAPAPQRAPQPTHTTEDLNCDTRNAKRSKERMKQYRSHLDRSKPRNIETKAGGSCYGSTRASAVSVQLQRKNKPSQPSNLTRNNVLNKPQELDVEECNRDYTFKFHQTIPIQLSIYQTALRTLDQRFGALIKGYRLRRALYNVREVREQMNLAIVQAKLWDEGLLVDKKELLTTRSELIEMVDFLQGGSLEWLRQGGHACVMSDKTFLCFEQECLYEKLRAELEHRNHKFNVTQQVMQQEESPPCSKLIEESLNLFNQRALQSTGTVENLEPPVVLCHQNESQETFAHNNYTNSHQVGVDQSRVSEEMHSFYHDQKAIPISQIINDSIEARSKEQHDTSSAFKFLSQEMPVPYTGQTTRSKKDCFVRECVLQQDAPYAVGQGLVSAMQDQHREQDHLENDQAGFVHSPPRDQTTEELHRRIMEVPEQVETRDAQFLDRRVIRPKRVTVDTSVSSRIPDGTSLGLGQTLKSATTPQVIQRVNQHGKRDIYMSFDAQAVELGRPAVLAHAYGASPDKSSAASKQSKRWSPVKLSSPVKSPKKFANKENPRGHNLPTLNFKKLERRQEDIFQVPRLSANTTIGGRRTRGQRSTQRSTNVTPKNGLTVNPQKRMRENLQEKQDCEQVRLESRQQRTSERRQVTVSDVLRLINMNKGTGRASDSNSELDVKALDKECRAQLRDAIGQLMRSLEDSPTHVGH